MSEVEGTLAANIWDRVIAADDRALSPDEARAILRWRFPESDRQRVDELSERRVKANFRQSSSMNWMSISPLNPRLLV